MDVMDINFQIHCIETDAYSAILRAFIAQSDDLSWGKEGLISELRKELNVSDSEHRELLLKVNSDDSVGMIRELRRGTACDQMLPSNKMNPSGSVPISMGHASQYRRINTSLAAVSPSPNYLAHAQPSRAAIPSPLATHFREGQWSDEAAMYPGQGNVRHSIKSIDPNRQAPSLRRGRRPVRVQSKKGFPRKSGTIKIRATDKLIREVERMINEGENPDPVQVEKAKLVLGDHERAILKALDRLADVSDGEDSPDRSYYRYSHKELERRGHGKTTHHAFLGQVDNRLNDYFGDGFGREGADRAGFPFTEEQDDDEMTP